MARALKIAAWIFGGLLVLVVLAAGGVYFFATSDYLRAQIENRANQASGRQTKIGDLEVHWGRTTHITLRDVEVSNTDWGKAPHMFEAKAIDLDIRLWPLLWGKVVIPQITSDAPKIALERNAKGESNWSAEQSPAAVTTAKVVKPEERSEAPVIGLLRIRDGLVSYTDKAKKLDLKGKVNTALGAAAGSEQVELKLQGTLEGKPLALNFTGGSVIKLRETTQPYPVDLDISFGKTKLALKGQVEDPFQFKGADVTLDLKGPDLAEIFPLLGIPAPPTPPYHLSGKLSRSKDVWKMTDMSGQVGDSDLSGTVEIDKRGDRNFLKANLVSKRLDFDDLGPLVGIPPDTGKSNTASAEQKKKAQQTKQEGNLFPDQPLHVEKLREMDMDVTLDARKVTAAPYIPVQALKGHVKIDKGKAEVDPLDMAVAGGRLKGKLGLDASGETPKASANVDFNDFDLKTFFRDSQYFDTTAGKVDGRIDLAGQGRSLAKVFGSADGDAAIAMTGGSISELLVQLAGLDIGHALILYITEDHRIPIRCAMGRLAFRDGTASFDKTALDTTKSVIHVKGSTGLNTQAIDMKIVADAKDFSLLDIDAPIIVKGKLRDPAISIGKKVPIPLIEPGGAKDLNCQRMISETLAREKATQ